jgi:formiminoglutamase/agmatinase
MSDDDSADAPDSPSGSDSSNPHVAAAFEWSGPSSDPNDRQFGDVVEPATLSDATEYDALVVGEPYDGAVIGRTGAREGPAALREALAGVKTHHFESGPVGDPTDAQSGRRVDAPASTRSGRRIGDVGDVEVPEGDVEEVQNAVRAAAAVVYETGTLPVFLGGDNSLSFANVSPLLNRGSVAVVSFDAHLDCREVRDGPSSGTPYRQLYEAGLDRLVVVGARHFETSTAYADYLDERGGTVVTSAEVGQEGTGVLGRVRSALSGVDAVYVSVDVDVLDATAAPGVSAPTPGGLSSRELYHLVREVARDDRVAGFEVVECAPPLDHTPTGRTAATGARAVAHFLSGVFADD